MAKTQRSDTLTDDDKALLTDYLDPLNSIFDLARIHGRRIADIAAWVNEPRIAEAIAQLAELSERRARTIAATNADTAARTLVEITADPTASPETRRRAATALRANPPAAGKPGTRTIQPETKPPSRREGQGVGSDTEKQAQNSDHPSRRSQIRRGGEGQGDRGVAAAGETGVPPDVLGIPSAHFPPFTFATDIEHDTPDANDRIVTRPDTRAHPIRRRAP